MIGMDPKKLAIVIISFVLVCIVLTPSAVAFSEEKTYEVIRNVEVKDGGLVYVLDSTYIDPGKTIRVGFDINLKDKLVAFYAEQAAIETRYVEEELLPSLFFIEIKNVGDQTIRAGLVTVFKNLVVEEDSKTFVANVPVFPVLRKTVESFYMVVRFPSGSAVELPERPGFNYTSMKDGVFMEAKNINLLSPMSVSVKFKNDKFSILFVERADVTVSIGDQRHVSFYLKIVNYGKSPINEINLLLPKDATLLNVKDDFGALSYSYMQEYGTLTVKTRWEVRSGEKVSFILEYLEPNVQELRNTCVLSFPSLLDVAYDRYILKVILPPGYEFKTSSPEPDEFVRDQSGTTTLVYIGRNVATLQPKFTISINYVPTMSLISYLPYLWIVAFGTLLTSAIIYRFSRRIKAPMPPEELKETLKTLTSGILTMIRNCEKLASSVPPDKKSLSRWSKSVYESELASIKKDIDKISTMKKKLGGFPEIMTKLGPLEVQLTELLGIMTALGRTVEDFRLGRIGKVAYERITKEYTKDVSSLIFKITDMIRDIEASIK